MKRAHLISLHFVFALLLAGCGAGGSQSSAVPAPTPTPAPAPAPAPSSTPDFTLTGTPAGLTLAQGSYGGFSITAAGSNGFSGQISAQVTGLPTGITATPSSFNLTSGGSQQITLAVAPSAQSGTGTAAITGTASSLSHTAQLSLSISTAPLPGSALDRTRYLRTDATTGYGGFAHQQYSVFDPVNRRFFVSDAASNRITAFDPETEKLVGIIAVPGAFGLDETPDHKTLFAGTQIGDVYAIDPASMTVTKRYIASQISPYGYRAYAVRVLADGRLALLSGQGGIPGVDGYGSVGVWDPTTNSIAIYASTYGSNSIPYGAPYTTVCGQLGNIGAFTLTGDRTHVIIASIDSDGTLCSIDASAGGNIYANGGGFVDQAMASPDGRLVVGVGGSNGYQQATVYDAGSLNVLRQFSINTDFFSGSSASISADSSKLYTTSSSVLYAFDLTSGKQVGWLPNLVVGNSNSPTLAAEDATGLLIGPMEEGVGFLDTAALRSGTVGSQFANGYLSPTTGPTSGGTSVQWGGSAGGSLSGVYIAGQRVSQAEQASNGQIMATTPAAQPGPADVVSFFADGGAQFLPEAFSYGPTLLQVAPNEATAEGGGTGILFGYGLGPVSGGTAIPSDLQITIDGKSAVITAFAPFAFGSTPPFPLQSVSYTLPPESVGTHAVAVTTNSGTTTQAGRLGVLPALQQYPLAGATLAQGIYDPQRDLYYFTDSTKVQVFSKTQGAWLAPIPIPAPTGAKAQRLWGIALSPDASKLAVSDTAAAAIYVMNPSDASSLKTYPVPASMPGTIVSPAGLAISDSGIVYYTLSTYGGTGFTGFFKLDTGSGAIRDYGIDSPGLTTDIYLRALISSDSSRVFFNNDGQPFSIDTATDIISYASVSPSCCYGDYDLALSSNQTSFAATGYLYDSDLNARSILAPNDRESLYIGYVYGAKLSPDGSLLFQPSTNGIDVYDGRIGNLRNRIALPVALSQSFDALVADGHDNVLVAITGESGSGIAVVDLNSLPEPDPLAYASTMIFQDARHFAAAGARHPRNKMGTRAEEQHPSRLAIPHLTNR